ncbi:MAG TPA: DegV family protein [Candidatus Avimonas sp.]|nr:DegV family protein [Candidatus Avimonas sp.]
MGYQITTDSTSDLPKQFYIERGIKFIGLIFQIDGKEYSEDLNLTLTTKEFYDMLRKGKHSTTTQINTYDFIEFAEPILASGEDILHIAFSSSLSGTYESCKRGAEELKDKYPERKIIVVDSLCASLGEGLLAYYADENRKKGMSIEENAEWLENHKLNICHWFTVDDLNHLYRGGRLSKTSAIFGTLLGIKPVLHMDDSGRLKPVEKARGRAASIDALVKKVVETANEDIKSQQVFISHADCMDDAKKLADKLRREVGIQNILISGIGAVIGSHSGPGTLAVFFMGKKR